MVREQQSQFKRKKEPKHIGGHNNIFRGARSALAKGPAVACNKCENPMETSPA